MSVKLTLRGSADVTILDVEGRATIGEGNDLLAAELRRLMEGGARKLLVNIRALTQIDSSGISTLVRAFITLGRAGGSLKLLVSPGRVRDALSVTRVLSVLSTFEDEAAALETFRTPPLPGVPTE